jgi:hypothetical protein
MVDRRRETWSPGRIPAVAAVQGFHAQTMHPLERLVVWGSSAVLQGLIKPTVAGSRSPSK